MDICVRDMYKEFLVFNGRAKQDENIITITYHYENFEHTVKYILWCGEIE